MNPEFQSTPLYKRSRTGGPAGLKSKFSAVRVFKFLMIVGVLVVATAVLIFLFGRNPFNTQKISLAIEGHSEASAGQEIEYVIKYKNNSDADLEKVRISFFYPPDSIVLREDGPSDVISERIEIGNLSPGSEGQKELRLFLVGDKGDIKNAKAIISFKPANVQSDFQKESVLATTITSVPVSLTLVAPPNAVPGQKISYLLDYRNESEDDITGARLAFSYPENFSPLSFSPQPTSPAVWDIPLIKKGQGDRIKIDGIISGNGGESKTISVLLQKKIGDKFLSYQKAGSTTMLSEVLLAINITVNNSESYISFPGDSLEYIIDFKNNSKQELTGVNISAELQGSMFDFETISADGFFDSNQKTIFWNASSVPQLGLLRPNDGGQVKFKVKLMESFPVIGAGSKDFFIKVISKGNFSNIPEGFADDSEISAQDEIITRIK